MTDIVEKLLKMGEIPASVARRAADEIERLRAECASKDVLIAEQNRLAKERQEWALHTNEVIRGLHAELGALRWQKPIAVVGNHQGLLRVEELGLAYIEPGTKLYAAPQPAIPDGWQPIETAPKDELILVGPTKRMGMCAAMNHSRDGWVTETPSEWATIYTPTHWMPLPAAPKPGDAK